MLIRYVASAIGRRMVELSKDESAKADVLRELTH
jgi:hypothetical protein